MKSFSKDAGSSHIKVVAIACIVMGVVLIAGALLLPKLLGDNSKDGPEETTTAAEVTTAEATHPEETTEAVTEATAAAQPTTEAPTTAAPTTEEPTTEIETSTEETMEYKTYMDKIRAEYVTQVPKDVQKNNTGKLEHIKYYSKKAEKEKGAYVWLPPEYSPEKKYPVFYVNHGITGDEGSMLQGFALPEMASNLIQSGEAEPMIMVFTFMYTNKDKANCTAITAEETPFYDAFLDDLTDSLMPYIEENYPVLTGFENTAIGGFSMGGRESLYISIMRPDLFGYVAASSPAPGVVPGKDMFMVHEGCMSEDEFKFDPEAAPHVLIIAGGTSDFVVGTFPQQYHELFEKNGTEHIWVSVPGGNHDGSVGIPLFYNFLKCLFKAGK
ncbi:MAG: esterase family protein [Lachnospiraceae bacterium]|nr:esterase family protein [Lachnospiraceae bacterium]